MKVTLGDRPGLRPFKLFFLMRYNKATAGSWQRKILWWLMTACERKG